jgi:hypothetical protein
MLTIEFKKVKIKKEDGSKGDKEYVIINGIPDEDSFFSLYEAPSAHFYNEEVINILTSHNFSEVGQILSKFAYDLEVDYQ